MRRQITEEGNKPQNRKRRRHKSDELLSATTGFRYYDIKYHLPNEDGVRACTVWHHACVSSEQKRCYDETELLTLANCFTLNTIMRKVGTRQ